MRYGFFVTGFKRGRAVSPQSESKMAATSISMTTNKDDNREKNLIITLVNTEKELSEKQCPSHNSDLSSSEYFFSFLTACGIILEEGRKGILCQTICLSAKYQNLSVLQCLLLLLL